MVGGVGSQDVGSQIICARRVFCHAGQNLEPLLGGDWIVEPVGTPMSVRLELGLFGPFPFGLSSSRCGVEGLSHLAERFVDPIKGIPLRLCRRSRFTRRRFVVETREIVVFEFFFETGKIGFL